MNNNFENILGYVKTYVSEKANSAQRVKDIIEKHSQYTQAYKAILINEERAKMKMIAETIDNKCRNVINALEKEEQERESAFSAGDINLANVLAFITAGGDSMDHDVFTVMVNQYKGNQMALKSVRSAMAKSVKLRSYYEEIDALIIDPAQELESLYDDLHSMCNGGCSGTVVCKRLAKLAALMGMPVAESALIFDDAKDSENLRKCFGLT